jgi:hypothetical protein
MLRIYYTRVNQIILGDHRMSISETNQTEIPVPAAAARCHMSAGYFRELLRAGKGPMVVQISPRKTFIRVADLEAWLESRRGYTVSA